MLHTFDGLGTTTLEIELLPGRPPQQGVLCRLVFESGHVEPVDLSRSFGRLMRHLGYYRVGDVEGVSRDAQGFRMPELIAEDITNEWSKIREATIIDYSKRINRATRKAFELGERDPTVQYVPPIEIRSKLGIRLNGIPIRIIDHTLPPIDES